MNIYEEVKGAKTIGISGHVRPDGDCVGSVMGLYLYLKKLCKDAQIQVMIEKPADIFNCISGVGEICSDFQPVTENFDVFIALDCEKSRLGEAEKFFDSAKKTVNIDHHISNATGCGDVNYVVPTASSASELVYQVMEDKRVIDEEIAKALYIGIIHDTGVFQYSNTAPQTLEIAAKLIAYGFDFPRLIDSTFYEKTFVQNRIMGQVLTESKLYLDGKCIVGVADIAMMERYQANTKDLDGIVSQLRNTKGVECALFLYEMKEKEYKASLRASGDVDMAKVASCFGGGGHVKAAGVTMQGDSQEIIDKLIAEIAKQL
ncbi:MAG: bifunctional oligoribonuclease/PAP phosphatase NrnA [Lachnospiraceae bacterium]|nr:bifunctional oligoribonuclease/PAP phosphatase NrnA [Lachnospiraceae bacterium]